MEVKRGVYMHFRGKEYEVLGTARHSETLEDFVVYRALYRGEELWIRPKKMFLEKATKDGKEVPRFEFVRES